MRAPICSLVLFFDVVSGARRSERYRAEDLLVPNLIRSHNYPVEVYQDVATEDSYLLDVYRIPHGRKTSRTIRTNNKTVLLMHGLMGTSVDFVSMGPEKGLAFILVDNGYDVWLPNARGTRFSRKHLRLDPDLNRTYWEFSWHEIGVYDLPAVFVLIRNVTGRTRLSYVGMSQGTTCFYVMASERPEFNRNVTLMVSLAPVAYMGRMYSPLVRFLAVYEPLWTMLSRDLGVDELPPKWISGLVARLVRTFCQTEGLLQDICASSFYLTGGFDPEQMNKTALPAMVMGIPAGASTRQLLHYAQNINSGKFRKYDHGPEGNTRVYGSIQPPSYDLSKVTSPVSLFYSEGDWLAGQSDVRRLCNELSNCAIKHKIKHARFNHYDFLFATDVVELVYNVVLGDLKTCDDSDVGN